MITNLFHFVRTPCLVTVLAIPFASAGECRAAEAPRANLVANGDFSQSEVGKLPAGWNVSAPNPALAPT